MKTCIFSPICQFAQFEKDNIVFEHEFNFSNDDSLYFRKLFRKSNGNVSECGVSCIMWNLTESLLSKNRLLSRNTLSLATPKLMGQCRKIFDKAMEHPEWALMCVPTHLSYDEFAAIFTYHAICTLWRMYVGRTAVYHLNFSEYLDSERKSWNINDDIDSDLIAKRNVIAGKTDGVIKKNMLVISGIDYVNFKDYESSSLLKILGTRRSNQLPTIVVGPEPSTILGTGQVMNALTGVLQEHKVTNI